jgi:hypothetical protein
MNARGLPCRLRFALLCKAGKVACHALAHTSGCPEKWRLYREMEPFGAM